jgi:hypothetical protein
VVLEWFNRAPRNQVCRQESFFSFSFLFFLFLSFFLSWERRKEKKKEKEKEKEKKLSQLGRFRLFTPTY